MNELSFLTDYLAEPEALSAGSQGGIGDFFSDTVKESPVTVSPGKALPPETTKAAEEPKSVAKTAKESLFPKVRKVADTKEKAGKILGAAVPDISEVPVPSGGIGLLLFISLVVVFAITPANGTSGATRLQMLWGSMLGNYSIAGNRNSSKASGSSGSASSPSGNAGGGMDVLIQGGLYT